MWGWAAALEDNRERREPFPRTGGKKPSRPEQRATSGRFFSSAVSPAEQVVSGERGGSDAAKRGAPHPSLFDMFSRRRRRGDEPCLSGATSSRSPLVGEHANLFSMRYRSAA